MRKTKGIVLGGLALGLVATAGHAAVVFDSVGYESPTYSVSTLQNQPASHPTWGLGTLTSDNGTTGQSSIAVENTFAAPGGGSQAVKFTRVITDADSFAAPTTPITISQKYVDISWSMYVSSTVTNDPYFGINAYNGNDQLAFGGVAVDNGTGYVISSGNGGFFDTANTVALNTWNNFVLQLNFNPTTPSVQTSTLFVNGVATDLGSFQMTNETAYTDGDLTSLDGTRDSSGNEIASAGTAYFDNYVVSTSSSPVPEANSGMIFLAGCGAFALLRVKRPRTSQLV